jgi:hypothetical protein
MMPSTTQSSGSEAAPLWPKPSKRVSMPGRHAEEKKDNPPALWSIPLNHVQAVERKVTPNEAGDKVPASLWQLPSKKIASDSTSTHIPVPKIKLVERSPFETQNRKSLEMEKNQAELDQLRELNKVAAAATEGKVLEPQAAKDSTSDSSKDSHCPPKRRFVQHIPLEPNVPSTTAEMTKTQAELQTLRGMKVAHGAANKKEELVVTEVVLGNVKSPASTSAAPRVKLLEQAPLQSNISLITPEMAKYQAELEELRQLKMAQVAQEEADAKKALEAKNVTPILKAKVVERIPLESSISLTTPEMTKHQAELEKLRAMKVAHVVTAKEHPAKVTLSERVSRELKVVDDFIPQEPPTKIRLLDQVPLESNISITTAEMSKNQAELEMLRGMKGTHAVAQELRMPTKPNEDSPLFLPPVKVKLVRQAPLESNAALVTTEIGKQQAELNQLREMKATRTVINKDIPPVKSKQQEATSSHLPIKSTNTLSEFSRGCFTLEMEKNKADLAKLREIKMANTVKERQAQKADEEQPHSSQPPPKRKLLRQAPLESIATSTTAEMAKQHAELEKLREKKAVQPSTNELPAGRKSSEQLRETSASKERSTASKTMIVQNHSFAKRRVSTMEMERNQAELQQLREMMQSTFAVCSKEHSEISPSTPALPSGPHAGTVEHQATTETAESEGNIRKVRLVHVPPFPKHRVCTIEMEKNQAELKQLRELIHNSNERKDPDATSMTSSLSSMAFESDTSGDDSNDPKNQPLTDKLIQHPPFVQRSRVSTIEMERKQAELMQLRDLMQRSDENKEPWSPAVTEKDPPLKEGPISHDRGLPLSTAPRIKLVQTCPFAKRRLSTMEMERTQAELQQLRTMKLAF